MVRALIVSVLLGGLLHLPALAEGKTERLAEGQAGSAEDQLALDLTSIPRGFGAVFVPSLTTPGKEPRVVVLLGEERVASGRTGQRLIVPPGRYTVVVGHGTLNQRAVTDIDVSADRTVVAGDFFGGLRVWGLSKDGRAQEVAYRIERLASDETVAIGTSKAAYEATTTAETLNDADTSTWLLPPGRYRIVLGDGPLDQAREVAISIHGGELIRYALVMDGNDLVSTRMVDELVEPADRWWKLSWVLGGTGSFDQSQGQLSAQNMTVLQAGVFSDATLGIDTGGNLATVRLIVDESWIGATSDTQAPLPIAKLVDRVGLEALYNYRLFRIVGPYVRGIGQGSLFPTTLSSDQRLDVDTVNKNGRVLKSQSLASGAAIETSPFGGPMTGQLGAGISLTAIDIPEVTLLGRAGPAVRAGYYQGTRVLTDVSRGNQTATLQLLEDEVDVGGEATLVGGVRLFKRFSYETTFDVFMPFADLQQIAGGDTDIVQPVFRWDNAIAFKLGAAVDVVYRASLSRIAGDIAEPTFYHGVGLRLSTVMFE